MHFKIDENVPSEVVDLLREAGHDAVSVLDQGLKGSPDEAVAQVSADEGRALITLDLDFSDIRAYPPSDYAGIIVFRLRDSNKYHLLNLLTRLLPVGSLDRGGRAPADSRKRNLGTRVPRHGWQALPMDCV